MKRYLVLHSAIGDATGGTRTRDEVVDAVDIADVARLLELGAVAEYVDPAAVVDQVPPITPPAGDQVAGDQAANTATEGDQVPPVVEPVVDTAPLASTPATRKRK